MSGAERSRSLKDLAKMAQSSPPSSMSRAAGPASVREDSGMIDLAATFGQDSAANNTGYSDPAAPMHSMTVEKSQNAMSVPHIPAASTLPSFDLPPSSHAMVAAPPSSALAPNSYAPESASSVASVAAPVSAHPMHVAPVNPVVNTAPAFDASIYAVPPVVTQKSGSGKVIAIGLVGLFAVAAAAAGFMFVSKSKTTDTAPVAKIEAPASPVAVAPKAETQAPVAAVDPNAGVDLNNLPTQAQPGKPVAPAAKAAPGGPLAAAAPLAAAPPAAEKPEAKKPEAPKAPEGPAGSLNDAMKQAVGPVADNANQAKSEGPQFAAGTVPQKPSQGALTSALASVMGSAKACGADEEGVSRATVTFQSAGTVQSVNVSGAAAGKPAAECIKGALMKAKVAPFAEPTFTTSVTIRH